MQLPELETMVEVTQTDANNYCRVLRALGMEEEGDPVAEIERMQALIESKPQWTEQRCQQLEMLRDLLHNVATINNGSHWLQKIQASMNVADALTSSSISLDQTSFVEFLSGLAIADRSGKAACNCRAGECESKAGCRMGKEVATRDPKEM